MLTELFKMLTGTADPTPLQPSDERLAIAALMVRVARADDDYDIREQAMIDEIITQRYGLEVGSAQTLREEAETLEREIGDSVRLTRVIKEAIAFEERDQVAECLWSVALADDTRTEDENAFLRMVVSLMGISDIDSNLARQRAKRKLAL